MYPNVSKCIKYENSKSFRGLQNVSKNVFKCIQSASDVSFKMYFSSDSNPIKKVEECSGNKINVTFFDCGVKETPFGTRQVPFSMHLEVLKNK